MNNSIPQGRIDDLALDAFAHENLVLRDRVIDLEADLHAVRELLSLALDKLHAAALRDRHLTRRIRALTTAAQHVRQAA